MRTNLSKLTKVLDIRCQHLGDECFYWIYAANIWRKYVILRVSVWGMCIFYWIYAAKIWEYMSFGGFLGALRAQGWEMYIFGHFLLIFEKFLTILPKFVMFKIFVLKVACPQSRLSSKSHVLKVACPQSRMSSKSCPQGRCPQSHLSSKSHRGFPDQ